MDEMINGSILSCSLSINLSDIRIYAYALLSLVIMHFLNFFLFPLLWTVPICSNRVVTLKRKPLIYDQRNASTHLVTSFLV